MGKKQKLSVSIDAWLYEAVDRESKKRKIAKSRIAQEALERWLRKDIEEKMAEGYEAMWDEDRELSDLALEAQKEILS